VEIHIYPGGSENGTGHVEYTYDGHGRLYQVIDKLDSTSSPRTTTYLWNPDGRLRSVTRPNETVREIGYDPAGRPQLTTEKMGATILLSWDLAYWPSDEIRTLDSTPAPPKKHLKAIPESTLTFDGANRVSTYNGQTIPHDGDGNSEKTPLPGGTLASLGYDSRNRLTAADNYTYTYNAENHRTALSGPGETTSFLVDPAGTLAKILARTKNGTTTRYVYGAGLQYEVSAAGEATYYHYDMQGNTAGLTNQAGALIDRILYTPYGSIRYRMAAYDTPFLFGGFFGIATDGNGLVHMRARYYNPLTMRFLNSDPAQDGWNWYAYANGNPMSYADPTGYGASRVLNAMQTGLSMLGFVPGLGAVADVVNAGISAARGDYVGAGMSLAAAVPLIGDVAAAGRVVRSTTQVARASHTAAPVISAARVEVAAAKGGSTAVYSAVENGVTKYVGITNDMAARAAAHLRQKSIVINEIPGLSNLARADARGVEQALIEFHGLGKNSGTLINKINSISQSNPIYADALRRGTDLLKRSGYPGF
jgi:RHS repeat-associated protein